MVIGGKSYFLLRETLQAFGNHNMTFPDLVDDYEKYHATVNTGNLQRAKLIEGWLERGSHVLDVGIGDGIVAEYLVKKRGVNLMGLDISSSASEKAQRLGIPTEVRDINRGLGLNANEVYDYILLIEVIEHTIYPNRILMDAVRHVRKGVIVTIPNSAYLKWRIQLLRGYFPRQSFTHLHFWSINDFKLFCNSLGIRTSEFKTFLPRYLLRFANLLAWQQCWLLWPHYSE
jgi:methionine biosynthesis protein MetW